MLPEALTALAAAAGTAVVQAAGTDAWKGIRERVARLFARGDARRESAESQRLDETAAALKAAPADRLQLLRVRHEAVWQTRFEELLEGLTEPERGRVAAELQALLHGGGGPAGNVSAETGGVAASGNAAISAGDGSVIGGTGNVAGGIHAGNVSLGGISYAPRPRPHEAHPAMPWPYPAPGPQMPAGTPPWPPGGQAGTAGTAPPNPAAGPRRKNRWVPWVVVGVAVSVAAFFGISYMAVGNFLNIFSSVTHPQSVVRDATGSPPWHLPGLGYNFTFNPVKRVNSSTACSSGPMFTIMGTMQWNEGALSPMAAPKYSVTNQGGYELTDAGSDLWTSSPNSGVPFHFVINVCAGTPPATRLTISITDDFISNAGLILQDIPVPSS
jgi:hypothetical protein